ncbi:MAG: response regulator [Paraprevotella sp.]|nr:response regulator [Paraprevotella sp.]
MMPIKVLIIEDEKIAAERIGRLLRQVRPDAAIAGVAKSIEDARIVIQEEAPDIVFSDIRVEDGLVFELFSESRTDIPVVFTTAYNYGHENETYNSAMGV